MKISKYKGCAPKCKKNKVKPLEKEVPQIKDTCDLEDSLTDWDAEQNQSDRPN